MGSSKRHQRAHKAPPPMRPRTTRSSKGRLLSDPTTNTKLLTDQLRQLGLYAADTVGDGNCLFRALSDQLYGTESHHLQIRSDVCDWIERHKTRYAPFVDDERGLTVHLTLMRKPATYGGHLELSAFAHMVRRNVKVIQPGLVYVIEWASGADVTADQEDDSSASSSSLSSEDDPRSLRLVKRNRMRAASEATVKYGHVGDDDDDDNLSSQTVYVAYHDWEHFSSIRNLRGPHDGPPDVRELSVDEVDDLPLPPTKTKGRANRAAATKPAPAPKPKAPPRSTRARLSSTRAAPSTPSQIPLPQSRSVSPLSSIAPLSSSSDRSRDTRSPKRTFDESSGSSGVPAEAKRSRHDITLHVREPDEDADTPSLSDAGSTASSPLSSASSSPAPVERPLTRRQRKVLGVPKPRPALAVSAGTRSAGKIVIPGGRHRSRNTPAKEPAPLLKEDSGEWERNGVGRVDVRGFRELRI
ncbi:cysteine proteinase [Auriscalpium vulgare]|uniref:Cysteine proteinase n=1 Tax=Auriscalpium vulgare TaxID=40419 RepID=A0ACB8RGY3_9AGAM|nr:cysteine proteinase [Auriscalpium vulgare]